MKTYLLLAATVAVIGSVGMNTFDSVKVKSNTRSYPIKVSPKRILVNWQEELVQGIMSFESFYAKPYRCPAGVLTVGYGHTGKHVNSNMSKELAESILRKDIEYAKHVVLRTVHVKLTEHQLASLTSFTFNCGEGSLRKLVNGAGRLNAGNYKSVEAVMPRYVMADGKKLRGLKIRRGWEVELWKGIFTI
jgi:lysozyme